MNPVRDNLFYVYVLRYKHSNRLYTGCTSNLRKRLDEHNKGYSAYTKGKGRFELVYFEGCLNAQDAYAREKYLKSGMGKRYLKNRVKRFLALTG